MITETIRRAQAGDQDAFAELHAANKQLVYCLLLRKCKHHHLAEDLTQDTFLQAFRNLNRFRGDAAFSTWITRIAINIYLMHVRRQFDNVVSLDEMMDKDDFERQCILRTRDLRVDGAVDRVVILRILDKIPPRQRTVLELKEIDGLEHNEVAARIGTTVGNSKSQLHKAKIKFRKILRKGGSPCRHPTF